MRGLLTIKEVAEKLRLTPYTVRRFIKEGKLPATKVGGQWRVREADLEAYLNR